MKKAIIGDLLLPSLKAEMYRQPYNLPIILLNEDDGWYKVLFFDGETRFIPQWMFQSYWEFR